MESSKIALTLQPATGNLQPWFSSLKHIMSLVITMPDAAMSGLGEYERKGIKMEIKRQVTVNASADKVWKILGADFNNISEWSSLVLESNPIPDLPPGSGRVCHVKGSGEVVETIYQYDDDRRELAFILKGKKIPFFMQKIDNTWSVKPKGDDRSELQVHVNVTVMPVFKQLMSGMLSKGMAKTADGILSELKYFAENDRPKASA